MAEKNEVVDPTAITVNLRSILIKTLIMAAISRLEE